MLNEYSTVVCFYSGIGLIRQCLDKNNKRDVLEDMLNELGVLKNEIENKLNIKDRIVKEKKQKTKSKKEDIIELNEIVIDEDKKSELNKRIEAQDKILTAGAFNGEITERFYNAIVKHANGKFENIPLEKLDNFIKYCIEGK